MNQAPFLFLISAFSLLNLTPPALGGESHGGPHFDEMTGNPTSGFEGRSEDWLRFFELGADPTQGAYDQAQGFYSDGSLLDALRFADDGHGFLKIQRPRSRGYATFDLIEVVTRVAAGMAGYYPLSERVQIGDVASVHGGRLASHASHQNGLDADIVYFRKDRREQDPELNIPFDEAFVTAKGQLTENFDLERNWALFRALVSTGRVNRIFVDTVIKKELCDHAMREGSFAAETETLRRLRPWPNHDDHLHLRITCPINSPRCVSQDLPPEGSGCDALNPETTSGIAP